ncbi:MAG: GMC family oxidoreductase N-terminal domain-containing protein [Nitrososphaerales archaeon]|nr:GMC family oxidoreductase N-terminal domain-containing protein [Nitrososphaerales archaeon]
MKLTPEERTTLRAVCDTIFPQIDDPDPFYRRKASDLGIDQVLADTIEHTLQPGNAEDFARMLRTFESTVNNLFLTGSRSKFSELDAAERQSYLQSWRDSRIGLKRTAFQALKRLTCFLAYSMSDANGVNPNWADIGYPLPSDSPAVPTPDDLRITPLRLEDETRLECDVCIVGSGAGGSVIADRLSEAGLSVLVIEQGPYETSETYKRSEFTMMQKLFQQSGTAATKDLSFVLLAGRGVGGGTAVNWNTCLKPPWTVLQEWESAFGIHGLMGKRFAAYVSDVWSALKVNDAESQRNGNNQALWDGCKALGFREGVDYEVIQRNAVGCQQRCDYCTYGCTYACKQSTSMNYLPSAFRRGARFLFDTRVDRVVVEAGAAKGVVATCTSGGKSLNVEVNARAVVAACGGIETPALLLRSGVKDGNVGKYLRLDPTVAVSGLYPKAVSAWAGPPQTVAVWRFINLDGAYHGFWVEAAPAHPGLFALGTPWVDGRQHKDFMRQYYARSADSIVLLRERSWGVVSVDGAGYPVVDYQLEQKDKDMLVRGMEETARILAAAGALQVWTTHNKPVTAGNGTKPVTPQELDRFCDGVKAEGIDSNRLMLFSAHLMGSCRMSSDPSKGPTSPSGELHSVKSLYIGDACVFPTTPAVNPMITIMAMARRTAESIITALNGPDSSRVGTQR